MGQRFQKQEHNGQLHIRDTEGDKWVRDGNGRSIRMDDEERIDNITDIMNKRVEGTWHE